MSRSLHSQWFSPFRKATYGRRLRPNSDQQPIYRRLRIELLEERRLLAITVNTLVDEMDGSIVDGDISLRDATALAAVGETIDFSVAGTINLTQGELLINKGLTINGPGAHLLTIDASGNDPTPDVNNGDGSRVFNIDDGNFNSLKTVSISHLTLTGGDVAGTGGAISARENLTVANCSITGNSTRSPQIMGGGGIYSSAGYGSPLPSSLTVIDCTITNNAAGRSEGGGIRKRSGSLVVERCTISGNTALLGGGISAADERIDVQIHGSTFSENVVTGTSHGGGAIFVHKGNLTLSTSTLTNNTASRGGGGLYLERHYQATVNGCTISGNSAGVAGGGGIFGGNLTVADSAISGNTSSGSGGGIHHVSGIVTVTASDISGNLAYQGGGGIFSRGNLTVVDTTISGNESADSGGGIFSFLDGNLTVANSTISGNAAIDGGGLFSEGNTTLRHSTIAFNTGSGFGKGIFVNSGSLFVDNSIVAQNTGTKGDINGLLGTSISAQFSLIGNNQGSGLAAAPVGTPDANGNLVGTSVMPINPQLGPLADNGGPTPTHALLAGSPAIDAGDPMAMAGMGGVPEFDQRSEPFTRVNGGRIDIGSIERQPIPAAVFGDYNRNGVVDTADHVVWRNTLGTSVTPFSGADGDGDGVVDQDDYDVWRAHFGQTIAAGGGASAEGGVGSVEGIVTRRPAQVAALSDPVAPTSQPPALPGVSAADKSSLADAETTPPAVLGVVGVLGTSNARRDLRPIGSLQDAAAILRSSIAPRDAALAAWLAGQEYGIDAREDEGAAGVVDDEPADGLTDSVCEPVDVVFGWLAATVL